MRAETVPGQFEHLDDVPLSDRLLNPPGEHRGGALVRPPAARARGAGREGLVGGEQRDSGLFELVLDLGAEIRAAGDPLDRLGDDRHETAVGPGGPGEQVLDSAVARDGDVELLVGPAGAAFVEVLAAGLHVVEMGDDDEPVQERVAGVPQLPGQRDRRVLGVLGRGPAEPRYRHDRRRHLVPGLLGGRQQCLPPREHRVQPVSLLGRGRGGCPGQAAFWLVLAGCW